MDENRKQYVFTAVVVMLLACIAVLAYLDYQMVKGQEQAVKVKPPRPVLQENVLELQISGDAPPAEKIFNFDLSDLGLGEAVAKAGAEGARPAAEAVEQAIEAAGDAAQEAGRQIPGAVEEAEQENNKGRRPK